ncbi:MAG: hypothetical protein FWD09_04365 [Lentimicrobiaceae bacterium]|nr:hypothetical protein [Lentimicrobiaceae bacterium]
MKTLHTSLIPLFLIIFFSSVSVHAQRLEVHGNLDLSTNAISNKVLGVGAAVDFDQWVKNVTFRAHFNWGAYFKKNSPENPRYQRFSGGFSGLYSLKIIDMLAFQCGAEVNFTHLRYSHIYGIDSTSSSHNIITWLQEGNFIGIGPHIGLRIAPASRLSVVFNFIPTYLIPVGTKSNMPTLESEYKKGIWLFQLQLGLSYKLFKPD